MNLIRIFWTSIYNFILATKNLFSNMKLRFKLVIAFLIIGVIPIFIIGYFSYNSAVDTILNSSEYHIMNIVDKVDKHMTSKILYVNYTALSITTNQYINESVAESQTPLELGRNIRKVESFFRNLIASREDISDIIIVDMNNVKYGTENVFSSSKFSLRDSKYYQRAIEGKGDVVWLGMYENIVAEQSVHDASKVLTAVSLIYDVFQDKIRGILVINIRPQVFESILNELYQRDNNITFITDQNNNVISSSRNTRDLDLKKIIENADKTNDSEIKIIDQTKFLITCKINSLTGWKIINAIPVNDLISNANDIRKVTNLLMLISLILIFIIAIIISHSITKPIYSLVNLMNRATQDNLNIHVEINQTDEIGILSNSFNIMIKKIRSLITEVYEERLNQKRAELEALQAQINPHFLYNTLDTINWMLIDQEQYEISGIVQAVGNLMKYCIRKDDALVTIEQELNHIENYLIIQKARMEDKLQYYIDISDDVKTSKIPKLIIQPIVENAIVHGIESKSSAGILKIYSQKDRNLIQIIVEDNGIGMSPQVLEMLLESKQEIQIERHTKIGVCNVNKRIQLKFGDNYGITVQSEMGKGTRVIISLPWFI